jgi:hypothetical protein
VIPDLIYVQESHYTKYTLCSFPGYSVMEKFGKSNSGGVAFFIKKQISKFFFRYLNIQMLFLFKLTRQKELWKL